MFFEILLLLEFFNKAISGGNRNSSLSIKRGISPILPSKILLKKLLRLLFRPSNNYKKPKKRKPKAALML